MDLSTSISITLFGIIVTIWFIWRKRRMTVFQRLGIPGPKPSFWTGNLKEMTEKGPKLEIEWIRKHGSLVGFYLGAKPILMVADLELLKTVLVKEFNDFVNKDFFVPLGGIPASEMQHAIGILKDEKWKSTRSIVTPSFSIAKLKMIVPTINESIDTFLRKIEEKANKAEPFDIYPLYRKLVLDIVTRASFGISTKVQEEQDSFFLKCVIRVLNSGTADVLNFVSLCFPETEPVTTWLKLIIDKMRAMFGLPSVTKLVDICEEMIENRKASPEIRRWDLLQSLIDANTPKEGGATGIMKNSNAGVEKKVDSSADKVPTYRMTNDEIKANSMVFIIAGYDTTGVSLAITTHFLVNNQDIQDRLRREIMEKGQDINYHSLTDLTYLDQVFSESLRIYPPITNFTTRVSSKQFKFQGMTIPKGMTLQVPLWYLHRSPDYWPEPETFRPERFSAENKSNINSVTHQPFGIGQRNCVGASMAKMVVKFTLARLLSRFRFEKCSNTETEIELDPKIFINYPKNGVRVLAVPIS